MAAPSKGKWQQVAARLKENPGQKEHIGDDLPYYVYDKLRAYGLNVRKMISTPRSESGLSHDLYTIFAWYMGPQTNLDYALDQLDEARAKVALTKQELTTLDHNIAQTERLLSTYKKQRRALGTQYRKQLAEVDTQYALTRKYEEELKLHLQSKGL